MRKIKHIAIVAENPFVTAEAFKRAFDLTEVSQHESEIARAVYLTDGYINLAIVCLKRTAENPDPHPDGYGLDHFGVWVDNLEEAEARAANAGAKPQAPFKVDLSKMRGAIFFEKRYELQGVKFDLSSHRWPTGSGEEPGASEPLRRPSALRNSLVLTGRGTPGSS